MLNIYTAALEGKLFIVQQVLEKEPEALNSHDEASCTSGGCGAMSLMKHNT